MSPAKAPHIPVEDLFSLVTDALERSINQPNILNYGEKDYPEQRRFHKSDKRGRFISGGNRGGKCLAEGTLVQMADGSVKRIEDIRVGEYVIAPGGNPTRVVDVWDKGFQPVSRYRIGRYQDIDEVDSTENHRFWSARSSHGNLRPFQRHPIKDLVHEKRGVHKIMRSQGTALGGVQEDRALVLGLMLGDGYFGPRFESNLQFTCADSQIIEDLPGVFTPRANPIQYGVAGGGWQGWLRSLGLSGTRSRTKFIPEEVWGWNEGSIAAVIAGLAVTDGSWWTSISGEHHFTYSSISKRLAEDFRRYAGVRLGIWGSKTRLDDRGNYILTYSTREALTKLSALPLVGRKRALAASMIPKRDSYSSHVSVKEYSEIGMVQCYDLSVEDDTHCFMLANGIFTSNTDSIVVESIWWATNTHPYLQRPEIWGSGPITQRFVVVDVAKGVEQIMLPKFQRWLSKSMLIDGRWDKSWDAKNLILTFSNGSTIDFVTHGMELSKLGGVPRHIIYFDEEPPRHIFNESMMRLIDYNGFWVISATPVKGMGWTYDLLWEPAMDNPEGNVACFTLSMEDNPYVEAEEEDRDFYMQGMDVQERAMREKGSFVARSGLVFPQFSPDTHVLDADQFDMRSIRSWEWTSSADFGINNPTAWLWHAVSPQGDIVTFAEHYASDMNVPQHAAVVFDMEDRFARTSGRDGTAPDRRVGDPAGKQRQLNTGTSVLTEYALRGIDIQVEGIPHDAMIGVEKMRQYFRVLEEGSIWGKHRPKWVILSGCVNLIKELKKLRWATYSSEKLAYDTNKREEVHKKDDHAFDSCLPSGSMVITNRGLVSIDEVTTDDEVMTRKGYRRVMRSWMTRKTNTLIEVETSSGEILRGTENHRVYTDRGWVRLDSVKYFDKLLSAAPSGDEMQELMTASGSVQTVDSGFKLTNMELVSIVRITGVAVDELPVYDLEVDGEHEFFAQGLLVHNCKYFATLMPDLAPIQEPVGDRVPVTISYQDMIARLSSDESVTFVDNEESNGTEWETTESEELYEGAYDG